MAISRLDAVRRDEGDPLARFRGEFVIDDPELIYLDGNSLGRLPVRARDRLAAVVDHEWGRRLIQGWGEGWFHAPQRLGSRIARLVGAEADEVIVSDSTTVNLFKLVVAALEARPGRTRIVTDDQNFPSDLYVLQGVVDLLNRRHTLHVVPAGSVDGADEAALESAIDAQTALVTLSHTLFKSGAVYDMRRVTELAHRHGALMLWDLSHSVGALPLSLSAAGVDLAVGCTYKYLNGGPGAPAFLYVRRDLQPSMRSPIWGWFGQQSQFDLALDYEPAAGLTRFLAGTPTMLSLAAIEIGVDLLLEAGMDEVRAKSVAQSEFLIELWSERLESRGFTLNSPRDARRRGSHVSVGHPDGLRIDRALIEEMKVLPDFRYPDNIRLGIAPLYTSFVDLYDAVDRLVRVMDERRYEKYGRERAEVT